MAYYEQGLYDVIIKDHGLSVSKVKNTPYVFLRFQPMKHNGETCEGPYEREVKLYLTDKTIERTVEHLRSLGFDGKSFSELENGDHSFSGVNTQLRCTHQHDGDAVYENWEFPAPSVQGSEKQTGMAKKLDAMYGKALKSGTSKPKSVKKTQDFVVESEEDCPF